ncbi:hypothetical protein MMC17_007638 [Xylographa soralifera]|nr:hypothetical protein [Xylographa soralifera]
MSQRAEEQTPIQAAPTQVRLTFGIELELFYTYDQSYRSELEKLASGYGIHSTPGNSLTLVYEIVARMLAENHLPVNTFTEDDHPNDYDKWTVKTEWLDPDFPDPNLRRVETEIVSRILVLEEKSFEEVRLVLAILESFPGPYKFYVNKLTGFHVHVGAQQEKFVLPWLKKFAQTVTAFEHEIESLHSDDRIQNQYATAPSQLPKLLSREGPVISLAVLDEQKTFGNLQSTFAYDRYNAYNFKNLLDPDSYPSYATKRKQTIEFRQHAGSLDADTICNWIEFVCALIKYSFRADHRENLVFLMNHLRDFPNTAHSIEDLMKKIGVPHLFAWYRDNNRISDRGRIPIEDLPEIDLFADYPDVQPLWALLRDDESDVEVGVGVRGVKRGREEDEEEKEDEASVKKTRRL